jgi:hypothetical protein
MADGTETIWALNDANDTSDNNHPMLVFDKNTGVLEIADDYEASNDPTYRNFTLTKESAVTLAIELLKYVQEGTTSKRKSRCQFDVEREI